MRAVWKFTIAIDRDYKLELPGDHRLLRVRQHGEDEIDVWAEVDTASPPVFREFRVYGTGHELPADWSYVGTSFDDAPGRLTLVWHVYAGEAKSA